MEPSVVRLTLSLIGPALFLTFSAAFAAAWLIDRRRRYLLLLASACFIFAIGAISQVLYWPRSTGANALVSGFLYTSAIGIAVFALLVRLGKAPPWPVVLIYVVAVVLTLAYFFYLERNLTARVTSKTSRTGRRSSMQQKPIPRASPLAGLTCSSSGLSCCSACSSLFARLF